MKISGTERFVGIRCYGSKSRGIGGRIKELPADFLVEEMMTDGRVLEVSEGTDELVAGGVEGRYTHFTLRKYNWDTIRAVKEISKRLGVGQKRLGFAGTKDRRAITTQRVSVYRMGIERLKRVKIKDVVLGDFSYADEEINLGDLWGNRFTVTIRDVSDNLKNKINKISDELKSGFPNFFGIQRFGKTRPITHLVGREILMGNFKEAVMLYLTKIFEDESDDAKEARKLLEETKNFKEALKIFPKSLGYESAMLNYLIWHEEDYIGALRKLPKIYG